MRIFSRLMLAASTLLVAAAASATPVTLYNGWRWHFGVTLRADPGTYYDGDCAFCGGTERRYVDEMFGANGARSYGETYMRMDTFLSTDEDSAWLRNVVTTEAFASVDSDLPAGTAVADAGLWIYDVGVDVLEPVHFVGSFGLRDVMTNEFFASGSTLGPGSYRTYMTGSIPGIPFAYAEARAGQTAFARQTTTLDFRFNSVPVPLPASGLLFLSGVAISAALRRKKIR